MHPSSFTYTYTHKYSIIPLLFVEKAIIFHFNALHLYEKSVVHISVGLFYFFFFQNCFVYSMSFYFHMNFVINLSILQKYKKIC